MESKRRVRKIRFECVDCGKRVHPASYRASCPACDAPLRPIPPPIGDP